jgi:protoporphyrin/coproporphyrin ferrochelatase
MTHAPRRGSERDRLSRVPDYDAVLLVSFGGPEGPDDVIPFLTNVTRGRGVPPERLAEVAEHYLLFGGVSPINAQNRELVGALRDAFAADGLVLPVYWGNRNWTPYLSAALARIRADGGRRVLAFLTSAYASYSGCRQYRENLYDALVASDSVGELIIDRVRQYFDHPGFVEPFVDSTLEAIAGLSADVQDSAALVFTTHSLPSALADRSGMFEDAGGAYVAQHRAVAEIVAERVAADTGVRRRWDLVYQSRSGPPSQPWLEPDIGDHLDSLAAQGIPAAVAVPIGFVSDHLEVVYDLDTLAAQTAELLGLEFARASTPGTDPRFVSMIVELVRERIDGVPRERRHALSDLGPWHDFCPAGCCPDPRGPRPAVAGAD